MTEKGADIYIEEDSLHSGGDSSIRKRVTELTTTEGYLTYAEEKKLLRKIDFKIMPLLILLYLCKNLDVNNISYLTTMNKGTDRYVLTELKMTTDDWAWTSTVYYIPFILFEVPSTILLKKTTPRVHQFRIAFLWGTVTACQAAISNKAGLLGLRFLLGMFEAGMYPGMLSQLVYWYRPDEVSTRFAILGVLGSFSSVLTAFIVYGLSFISGKANLSGWQWVFLLEGVFTVLCSFLLLKWLPNYPDDSKWLTEEEKAFLVARLPPLAPKATDKDFVARDTWNAMKKPSTIFLTLLKMFQSVGSYGLSFWLPTIVASFGLSSSTTSPLMSIPSAFAGVLSGIGFSYLVDQTYLSAPVLVTSTLLVSIGSFIVLATVQSVIVLYVFIIVATITLSSNYSAVTSWMAQSLKGSTEVGFVFSLSNALAQLGGIIGPQLFRLKFSPRYTVPYVICIVLFVLAWISNFIAWYITRHQLVEVTNERKRKLAEEKADPNEKPVYNHETIKIRRGGETKEESV